jgi:hypothetical protein
MFAGSNTGQYKDTGERRTKTGCEVIAAESEETIVSRGFLSGESAQTFPVISFDRRLLPVR